MQDDEEKAHSMWEEGAIDVVDLELRSSIVARSVAFDSELTNRQGRAETEVQGATLHGVSAKSRRPGSKGESDSSLNGSLLVFGEITVYFRKEQVSNAREEEVGIVERRSQFAFAWIRFGVRS